MPLDARYPAASFCTSTLTSSTVCGVPCAPAPPERTAMPMIAALARTIDFLIILRSSEGSGYLDRTYVDVRSKAAWFVDHDEPRGVTPYFVSASLRPPTALWTLPSTLSALPSASSLASPVALPMVSLIEPLISFADPAIRSLFMTVHFYRGHKFRVSKRPYDEGGAVAV